MVISEKIAASKYYDLPNDKVQGARLIASSIGKDFPGHEGIDYNRVLNGAKYKEIANNILKQHGEVVNGKPMFSDYEKGKLYHTLINHKDVKLVDSLASKRGYQDLTKSNSGKIVGKVNKYMVEQASKKSPLLRDSMNLRNKSIFHRDNASTIYKNGITHEGAKLLTPKQSKNYEKELKKAIKLKNEAHMYLNDSESKYLEERADKFKKIVKSLRNII